MATTASTPKFSFSFRTPASEDLHVVRVRRLWGLLRGKKTAMTFGELVVAYGTPPDHPAERERATLALRGSLDRATDSGVFIRSLGRYSRGRKPAP